MFRKIQNARIEMRKFLLKKNIKKNSEKFTYIRFVDGMLKAASIP